MMYRDSRGRIRNDSIITRQGGPNSQAAVSRPYEINDPVAGYRYIVDDFHQIVYRIAACIPLPPGSPGLPPPAPQSGAIVTDDLGTQTMQGITVTGQRETTTFPPGAYRGNDAPVTRVEEVWRSKQLEIPFLTKTTTPEGKTTTQTMTNFTAGEPNPALFQPPPSYQIVDETADFKIAIPFK